MPWRPMRTLASPSKLLRQMEAVSLGPVGDAPIGFRWYLLPRRQFMGTIVIPPAHGHGAGRLDVESMLKKLARSIARL